MLDTSNQKSDSILQQSVFCQLSLLFSLGSLKTPLNRSKLVLSLTLLFSKIYCFDFFIVGWSSKHRCLVSTLQQSVLCQLSLLFSLGSLKTPLNKSKRVLSLSLLFSTVICCDFLLWHHYNTLQDSGNNSFLQLKLIATHTLRLWSVFVCACNKNYSKFFSLLK